MFKHLLVPLDGSRLAEAVLPASAYLAQTLDASVTLLHLIERDAPLEIHGDRHLNDPDEACAYLDEVATRAFPPNLQVERHVHTTAVSDVACSIVDHAGELTPDLIVMCTHGRGGLRGWLIGSIAQQVIKLGTTPVLLIRPPETDTAPAFTCRRLLVPLDGDPDHEQGLAVAADLAQTCGASLHLVMAVHTLQTLSGQRAATAKLLPRAMSALLDLTQQGGKEYLDQRLAKLQTTGLAVTARVARGDPAKIIVRRARQVQADLIVMGTHGKKGVDAFWAGSVAPKVSNYSRRPLLLVPVRGPEAEPCKK